MYINNASNPAVPIYNFSTTNNIIILEWNENLESLDNLFYNCKDINFIDLSDFNSSLITSIQYLFSGCSSLSSINFKNFNTSLIKNMTGMFADCSSLKELDLSNFNTNKIYNMSGIFSGCSSLISLDISSFDASFVKNMSFMFYNCSSLKSLNLTNFDTSKVVNISHMFYACKSLISLDISNFNTSSLIFIQEINNEHIFDNTNIDLIIYLNYDFSQKIIEELNGKKNLIYCIKEEPFNISINGKIKPALCHDKCSQSFPFKFINNPICLEECNINEFFKNECILNYKSEYSEDFILNYIKDKIDEFDLGLISDNNYNKFLQIQEKNKIFTIIKFENLENINLRNLQDYSKEYYEKETNNKIKESQKHITSNNHNLVLLIINIYLEKSNIKENITLYEIYKSNDEGFGPGFKKLSKMIRLNDLLKNCSNQFIQDDSNCTSFSIRSIINQTCNVCSQENQTSSLFINDNFFYKCFKETKLDIPTTPIFNNETDTDTNIDTFINTESEYKVEIKSIEINNISQNTEGITQVLTTNIIKQQSHEIIKINISDIYNFIRLKEALENNNNTLYKNLSSVIINNMNIILENINPKNGSIVIEDNKDTHLLSTLGSNLNRVNYSSINFGECGKRLKDNLSLSEDEDLILYEIEHNVDGLKIPIIEYALFTSDGNKQLNLSLCNNLKVKYNIPVDIDEDQIDQYDPESVFYNDKCNKYSEDGIDITLYDRKNNFNSNNMSLCEKKCSFINYNTLNSKVVCDCDIKDDINYNSEKNEGDLINKIDNEKSNSNLGVTQCLANVELKSNSGFITLLIILIVFIIVFIIFCIKGKKNLEDKIDEVIYNKFTKNKENSKDKKELVQLEKNNKVRQGADKNKIKKVRNKTKTKHQREKVSNIKSSVNRYIKQNTDINVDNLGLNNITNINLDVNRNIPKIKELPNNGNDYEMNNLLYLQALKYDNRTCCEYYCSLLKNKQLFMFTFCSFNDYNSGIIKKFTFFLGFAVHYTINALFFNDDTMHKIYEDGGGYNISYHFPKIFISTIASILFLRIMLETLILNDRNVLEIKHQATKAQALEMKLQVLKCTNIKYML